MYVCALWGWGVWGVLQKKFLILFDQDSFLSLSPLLWVRRVGSKLPTITFNSSPLFNDAAAAMRYLVFISGWMSHPL